MRVLAHGIVLLFQTVCMGSLHPMCKNKGTRPRDNSGPLRLFLLREMYEKGLNLLDYQWLALLVEGCIKNTYYTNDEPHYPEQELNWGPRGVVSGLTRAESASYVLLMHWWYWKALGPRGFIFPFAWRSMEAPNIRCRDTLVDVSLQRKTEAFWSLVEPWFEPPVVVRLALFQNGADPSLVFSPIGLRSFRGREYLPWRNRLCHLADQLLTREGVVEIVVK